MLQSGRQIPGEAGENEELEELLPVWALFRDPETADLQALPIDVDPEFKEDAGKMELLVRDIAAMRDAGSGAGAGEFAGILDPQTGDTLLSPAELGHLICTWLGEAGGDT